MHSFVLRKTCRQFNVNATVCPFELMGRCEDTDCSYLHLTRVSNQEDLVTDVPAVEQWPAKPRQQNHFVKKNYLKNQKNNSK